MSGQRFEGTDLRGARFVKADLSGAVLREVMVEGLDLDAPWLVHSGPVLVNGVDVAPYVEAELNLRFPGRAERFAEDPDGLRAAWSAAEAAWADAVARAATLPEGTVDVRVDGEWSFAETLRHLVMATDTWLGRAVLEREQPYHPLGIANPEAAEDGLDLSVFAPGTPAYADVLAARADRQGQVRDFLADLTTDDLEVARRNPWAPQHPETTRSCLHTVLEEEWEHLRYATRDLDVLSR